MSTSNQMSPTAPRDVGGVPWSSAIKDDRRAGADGGAARSPFAVGEGDRVRRGAWEPQDPVEGRGESQEMINEDRPIGSVVLGRGMDADADVAALRVGQAELTQPVVLIRDIPGALGEGSRAAAGQAGSGGAEN